MGFKPIAMMSQVGRFKRDTMLSARYKRAQEIDLFGE